MQTSITPVPVYPRMANTLYIRPIAFGPPPAYYYELQSVPTDPSVPGEVVVLKNGNVAMTEAQWDAWQAGPASGDDDYQLDCITANLGLTRT